MRIVFADVVKLAKEFNTMVLQWGAKCKQQRECFGKGKDGKSK